MRSSSIACGAGPDGVRVDRNRGEGGLEHGRDLEIAEAGDGEVFGHPDAEFFRREDSAGGEDVAGEHHRRDVRVIMDHPLQQLAASAHRHRIVGQVDHSQRLIREEFPDDIGKSHPARGGAVVARRQNPGEGQPLVPSGHELPDEVDDCLTVGEADEQVERFLAPSPGFDYRTSADRSMATAAGVCSAPTMKNPSGRHPRKFRIKSSSVEVR